MQHAVFRKILAVLFGLVLAATGLWASPAGEEEPAAAMEKEMVTDPTTGKMVTAPVYGGTITYPYVFDAETTDPLKSWVNAGYHIASVNERLAWGDWGTDRDVYDFRDSYVPDFAITGSLAESWETPDPLTYIFHIRSEVHYALDPDSEASRLVNGRELTADDVAYNWQRNNAQGDFTERPQIASKAFDLPWESIEATDQNTVVMKMTEPSLIALRTILIDAMQWILPPEVIEKYGNYEDWTNVVGTGPLILTDYVEGVSITWKKNPDYWRYDEKYPENRLPYIDAMRALHIEEEATRISALRTGKVDIINSQGTHIRNLDVVRSLQRTNPDIQVSSNFLRSDATFSVNIRKPPFDDIRVRHAMQMALDLETINDTYYGGLARWEPMGGIASKPYGTTFEDYPEDLKQYFTYDPEGAEKLLDEAGYPRGADGVRFKVELDHRDVYDLGYREIAVGYWEALGVEVKIEIYDTQGWAFERRGVGERTEDVPQEDLLRWDMSDGDGGMYNDADVWVANYRQTLQLWRDNVGGVETPELTAAYDAFYAATTHEEQLRAFKEWDMLIIRRHNQIWGPMSPLFMANQPWVKGFSGEMRLHEFGERDVLARLWIDQGLKEAMGY